MCVRCLTQDWAFEQALLSRGRYFPGGAGLLHKPPGVPSNWDYRTAALARGSLDPVERREHFRPWNNSQGFEITLGSQGTLPKDNFGQPRDQREPKRQEEERGSKEAGALTVLGHCLPGPRVAARIPAAGRWIKPQGFGKRQVPLSIHCLGWPRLSCPRHYSFSRSVPVLRVRRRRKLGRRNRTRRNQRRRVAAPFLFIRETERLG